MVDPGVVLSFDRTGFRIHALTFDPADLDVDLAGRRCLVTGANSGIGYATARALADLGADVVLLCRNAARGEEARRRIAESAGKERLALEQVDMADLDSVRAVGERLAAGGAVDALVHNAGLLPGAREETPQGHELTFATHVLGPHLLTTLLRPALARSVDARVVWVSSGGMYTRKLALDDPDWVRRRDDYDGTVAYAETKRAQVVLAELWAEALRGTRVRVNAMHPGWAETPGVERSLPTFAKLSRPFLRTPAEGADTAVWLVASEPARALSGRFVFDRRPRRTHVVPWMRESEADRRRLWQLVESATAPFR